MDSHTSSSAIDAGAHQAATGHNALAEPTAAQRAAGNYKLGRIVVQGLRIAIENPRGTYREGVDADGAAWRCRMAAHYGYLSGTRGADGDGVDVFVGPAPESPRVWVINQVLGGQFDEHKVMLGFVDEAHARATYLSSYSPGWQGLGDIVPVSLDQLRWWLRWGDMARPLTPDQLPHAESESTQIMDRVTWTRDAQPHGMSLGKLLYNLRTDASGDPDLLMDAVTMDDLMQDPSIEQILMLDALVVEVGMMQRKMEQLNGLLLAAGQTVKPTGMEIGEPVRARGVLQIPVLFTMSDGQTLAVWFHNPDTTPAKLTPMDVLTSWKWQINKKDVTIVVAPERGADLQPRVVARRIMALVEKNSPSFQRANARTAEKASQIEALKGEVAGLERTLAGLNRELAIAKEEKLARDAAKPAKKSFTYAVKPVDGGFVIESNNGGGILNTVPPRKFASESAARDYMAKKGMVEEAAAVAAPAAPAPAAPAQAAQPADPAADVLDYLQYLARDMSGVENLLDMAARVDAAQSTYGTQDAQVRARQAGYAISWSYKTGRMPVEHAAWAKSVTDVDQCVKILAEVAMNGGGSVQSAVDAFGAIASRHAHAAQEPAATPADSAQQIVAEGDEERKARIRATPGLQRTDEDIAWYSAKHREEQAAALAQEEQAKADIQRAARGERFMAYVETIADPKTKARVTYTLMDLSKINGTPEFRSKIVERRTAEGFFPGERAGKPVLQHPDGRYAASTKIENDYANWLIEREAPAPAAAADLFGDTGPAPLAPEGAESKVKTAKGTEVLTGYTVVEADRLITSHDPATGDANPAFPAELQPRDRGRDASIAWVRKTAQDLDPDLLGKSRRADSGAPIVGPDGVVESGNGRTMAVVLAYQTGKADDYRTWLESKASYFGLSPEKVKGKRRPVLVRVRTSQVDRAAFAVEANQDDKLAMTATEVAKADANRLTDDVVALMTEDGDLTAAANVPFLAAFLRTLGDAEAARYSTSDGKPTASLIARVQAAIFAKAYQDDRLLELTADVAKPEIANIVKALNHAAPEFIQAAALDPAAAGDATGKLTDAVEKSLNQQAVDALLGASNVIRQAKEAGQTVDEFVKQSGLFGDIDPDVAAMAVFISQNNRSAKRMGDAFKAMATFIKGEVQRRQTADMFGDGEPVDFKDIVAAANRELQRLYGEGAQTIGLFERPAEPAPAAGLTHAPAKVGDVVASFDAGNNVSMQVVVTADGHSVSLLDIDSGEHLGFARQYKGADSLEKATEFARTEADLSMKIAENSEAELDPVAAVDAVYRFDAATDEFKAEVAQSLDDEDYSPFATARDIDTEVKKRGGTVSWALVAGAILDSADGPDDEPDDGDEAGFGLLDGVLILDGDFKGHPFRGNQYGRGSSKSSNASRASREAKRAERKAGGHDRVMQYVHSSAAHAHKQAAKGAKGKTRAYHAKMAKFHAKRAQHHQDKIDGKMVLDSAALAAFEAEAWPDAALTVMDSAAGGDPQGVIRAGGKVLGRAVIGGDGKAMIYVGAKGKTRVTNPSGATAIWGEYPSVMVEGLFAAKKKPAKAAAIQPATPTAEPAASTMTNDTTAAAPAPSIKQTLGRTDVGNFIPKDQLTTMLKLERGEEGQFFRDKVKELADQIASMPATYGQDGKGDQAVAHLHYFSSGADWYITEKDMDGGVDQAFGLADLGDGGELGYISIRELAAVRGVSLDLHWTPKTLAEIRGAQPETKPDAAPAAANPARAADLDFLRGIIAKTGDYTSDATLERLESLLAAYEGDAEVEALAAQAADVVQEAIVSQAQAVMSAG